MSSESALPFLVLLAGIQVDMGWLLRVSAYPSLMCVAVRMFKDRIKAQGSTAHPYAGQRQEQILKEIQAIHCLRKNASQDKQFIPSSL